MNPATPTAVESAVNILLQSILNENSNGLEGISTTRLSSRRTDAKTHSSLLAYVDDHADAIKTTLDNVQCQLLEKISALRTDHNKLIPLHQFPIEIFVQIMAGALGPLRDHNWSRSTHLARLVRLCQVCKHWKDVIDGTPSLWATIDFLDPVATTSTAISRSAGHPLNIMAVPYGTIKFASRLPAGLEEFINTAMTLSTRWCSIQIAVASLEKALAIMNAPAPLLQTLELKSVTQMRLGFPNGRTVFQGTNPKLRRLGLHCVAIPWDSYLLRGLQRLSISGLNVFAPSCEEILEILGACPGLVELDLSLKSTATVEGSKRGIPFTLAELRSLSISLSPSWTLTFLETIRFRSIESVSLNLDLTWVSDHLFSKLIQHSQALFSVVFEAQYKLLITVLSDDKLRWACKPRETSRGSRKFTIAAWNKSASKTVECLVETLLNRFPAEFIEIYFDCSLDLSPGPILKELDGVDCINHVMASKCDLDPILTYMSGPTTNGQWGFPMLERLSVYDCDYDPQLLLSMVEARYGLEEEEDEEEEEEEEEEERSDISEDQPDLPPPLKRIVINHAPGEADEGTLALVEDILGPDCLKYDENAE
ncbi:hypothetical protein M407DRAFT_27061 [Tulasnella calospora MUT 4182]|uniref:F-box domain-containing protein n=1 Tax=Tulasnella calospora MUT 4182 TaxID=1051891 RepID=A0A0C3QEK0_9AGAM|nr:hypothetical protein M407DRAFT_27061 [Tulasnella calospora MUT 4182]